MSDSRATRRRDSQVATSAIRKPASASRNPHRWKEAEVDQLIEWKRTGLRWSDMEERGSKMTGKPVTAMAMQCAVSYREQKSKKLAESSGGIPAPRKERHQWSDEQKDSLLRWRAEGQSWDETVDKASSMIGKPFTKRNLTKIASHETAKRADPLRRHVGRPRRQETTRPDTVRPEISRQETTYNRRRSEAPRYEESRKSVAPRYEESRRSVAPRYEESRRSETIDPRLDPRRLQGTGYAEATSYDRHRLDGTGYDDRRRSSAAYRERPSLSSRRESTRPTFESTRGYQSSRRPSTQGGSAESTRGYGSRLDSAAGYRESSRYATQRDLYESTGRHESRNESPGFQSSRRQSSYSGMTSLLQDYLRDG